MKKTRAELKAEKVNELLAIMDSVSDDDLEKWYVSLQEPIRVPTTWTTTSSYRLRNDYPLRSWTLVNP